MSQKLNLRALIGIVVGSMIGGGVFSLSQNLAQGAGSLAILLSWIITALGMLPLALVYSHLCIKYPKLTAGIYGYAKNGFGNYIGFNCAWGYWLSSVIGNFSYAILLLSSLTYFFPHLFGFQHKLASLLITSAFLWSMHTLISQGMSVAAVINFIVTIAKLIPIFIAIFIFCFKFKLQFFLHHIWGAYPQQTIFSQVKNTMLTTVWIFIGVEGAIVLSAKAKRIQDVARATFGGMATVLIIYVILSILPFGIYTQQQLATMPNPALAYILSGIVGSWGALLINIGLMISLIGAWIGWTMIAIEIPFESALDGNMPKFFTRENKHNIPIGALWATTILIQILLIIAINYHYTYFEALQFASSCILVPYLFSMLFAVKNIDQNTTNLQKLSCYLALIYSLWLLYAAWQQLLLATILYAIGTLFYIKTKINNQQQIFSRKELLCLVTLLIICGVKLSIFITNFL